MQNKNFKNIMALSLLGIAFNSYVFASNIAEESFKQYQAKQLTGDTKTACEVILCLSSPSRPSECSAPIAKYFSISAKKWKDTIKKRKNFLKLCPTGGDREMENLAQNIIPNLEGDCSVPQLNARIESKVLETYTYYDSNNIPRKVEIKGHRINPKATRSCELLSQSPYTDFRLSYQCSQKFYKDIEWQSSKEILGTISKAQYEKLDENQRLRVKKTLTQKEQRQNAIAKAKNLPLPIEEYDYYQTKPINKTCWVNLARE
ncbi:TrbM/KikA/MpfK family conjugal transfer protein [Helicobacter sp. MIT 05-5294]|uniref:TrbM/KikA/MpfK family conjugal transfer protein n=1 Tax=Helicobacter sp. MIT 05-5294 TaxID=1548150 RepID=UPI000A92A768|nr:TrbM/KikA/MpfK family conjugal transfer protein [Helicobacter sp. MIT 05-5294]